MIKPLPRNQTIDELAESLLICTKQEMIEKLKPYADLGIDRVILNINFGTNSKKIMDSLKIFAEEVMPHFSTKPKNKISKRVNE